MRTFRRVGLSCVLCLLFALVVAASPTVADPVGTQFRITNQGYDENPTYQARQPDIAYNAATNQYLVVFIEQEMTTLTVKGQLVDASGGLVGSKFAISPAGALGGFYQPPAVAYDATDNQFLVAWYNDSVYAQRIAATGSLVGSTITLSSSGGCFETVDIAWSPDVNTYLVVWGGCGETYGRLVLGVDGTVVGSEPLQISHSGDIQDDAVSVAYNSVDDQFLVAWRQYITGGASGSQIWGQRVETSGSVVSTTDVQISENLTGDALRPRIAFDAGRNRYLVIWRYDSESPEIFGQFVAGAATLVGSNFQISHIQPATPEYQIRGPDVAYLADTDSYLAVFEAYIYGGTDQVYGDYITGSGQLTGNPDFQVSDMTNWGSRPTVDANTTADEFMVTWWGETTVDSVSLYDQVWGRRVSAPVAEYTINFVSPAENATVGAGKPTKVEVWLGEGTGNTRISDPTASAIAASCQVKVSVSGAQTLTDQCMKYNKRTNTFTYSWKLARGGSAGAATITVAVSYTGISTVTTAERAVTIAVL